MSWYIEAKLKPTAREWVELAWSGKKVPTLADVAEWSRKHPRAVVDVYRVSGDERYIAYTFHAGRRTRVEG